MNIMLTDIRSLTLEMQDMPVVTQADADSFPHLLQQQFPEDAENSSQVIEFNQFFENISDSVQASEPATVGPMVAAWQDFLAQQQIRITTEIDPVSVAPVETSVAQSNQTLPFTAAGGTGEQLPFGGNSLPAESIDALAVPRGENMPTVLSVDAAIATLDSAPVAAEPLMNAGQPVLTPVPVNITGSEVTGAPASLSSDRLQSVVAGSMPARLAGGQPSPVAPASMNAVDAEETANGNEPDARAKMPAFATQVSLTRADATGERMSNPAALADDKPDGLAQSANPARESVGKDLPLARDPEAALATSVREARISNSGALPGELTAGGDRTGANELPDTFKAPTPPVPTPPVKPNPETVAPELAANRNLELAPQNSTSQSQQAMTASSASGHSHAFSGTVTAPTVIQNPLPAQLESMNLGRAADAGEWGDGLGERVNWMINQKQNSATIRLDPPMLGKLEVQIKIADDATTITIQTQHAQTRDLIETASVRLRDFLQESGYQNVNVDVSQRQDQQQARSQTPFDENPGNQEELQSGQESAEMHARSAGHFIGDGLLDTFA